VFGNDSQVPDTRAEAGVQNALSARAWVPAFAGMTSALAFVAQLIEPLSGARANH
jgi:hypothetical protein